MCFRWCWFWQCHWQRRLLRIESGQSKTKRSPAPCAQIAFSNLKKSGLWLNSKAYYYFSITAPRTSNPALKCLKFWWYEQHGCVQRLSTCLARTQAGFTNQSPPQQGHCTACEIHLPSQKLGFRVVGCMRALVPHHLHSQLSALDADE